MTQVLEGLAEEGYDSDFFVDDEGAVCCHECGACTPASNVRLDGLRRIEGVSDPADMAAVVAVTCPACERLGTAVVRYGPEAGPGDALFLLAIDDTRAGGADVASDASHTEPRAADPDGSGTPDPEADPDEPVGDFGSEEQSDQGGDSDVDSPSAG
jgi:hypothetical protein